MGSFSPKPARASHADIIIAIPLDDLIGEVIGGWDINTYHEDEYGDYVCFAVSDRTLISIRMNSRRRDRGERLHE